MSTKISRILFATDLSDNSYFAFRHAVALAHLSGAEIHVLHVVEPLSDDAKTTLLLFVQDEKKRQEAMASRIEPARVRLQERQDKFWGEVEEAECKVRDQIVALDVVEGYAAEEILSRANANSCDLIVLGTHQHGFSHTFLGSTAKRVLRRSRVPTLIVPHQHDK